MDPGEPGEIVELPTENVSGVTSTGSFTETSESLLRSSKAC